MIFAQRKKKPKNIVLKCARGEKSSFMFIISSDFQISQSNRSVWVIFIWITNVSVKLRPRYSKTCCISYQNKFCWFIFICFWGWTTKIVYRYVSGRFMECLRKEKKKKEKSFAIQETLHTDEDINSYCSVQNVCLWPQHKIFTFSIEPWRVDETHT